MDQVVHKMVPAIPALTSAAPSPSAKLSLLLTPEGNTTALFDVLEVPLPLWNRQHQEGQWGMDS